MSLVTGKQPQTKLGKTLRDLAIGLEADGNETDARRCLAAANGLDNTAISLGRRGKAVMQLSAYRKAARVYEAVTFKPYVG